MTDLSMEKNFISQEDTSSYIKKKMIDFLAARIFVFLPQKDKVETGVEIIFFFQQKN